MHPPFCSPIVIALSIALGTMVTAWGKSPLRGEWELVTESAQWGPRDTAEPFVFDGKLWISNGYYHGGVLYPDLWFSKDGKDWSLVLEQTPYPPYSETVVYKDRLWAIKGSVWTSTDGRHWEQLLEETPFGTLGYGEAVVHNGKVFQLGSGRAVYATEDGVVWDRVTGAAPYGSRSGSAVVSWKGRLWLMGGRINTPNDPPEKGYEKWTTYNDVWSSEDGDNWVRVLENAPWVARTWVVAEVYRDLLWIIGGFDNVNNRNLADVWYTKDGVTWHEMPVPEAFKPRHEATQWVFQDSLWIAAGNTWPVLNDVWKLTVPQD